MIVVLGLVLSGLSGLSRLSAREPGRASGSMDRIQPVALVSALLLVNLAAAAWLSFRFLAGRSTNHRLERWQTAYLPVFALWAAGAVVVLPALFDFA